MKRLIESKTFCSTMKKIVRVMARGPWCMIGGRAVEVYSNPPQTPDVDVLCDAQGYDMAKVIAAFKKENVRLREEYSEGYIIFMEDRDNGVEVDVMPTFDRFEIQAIATAEMKRCGPSRFPVINIEDLVIMKAVAACSPGSGLMGRSKEKKLRDIKAIIVLQKENDLNASYIAAVLKEELMAKEEQLLKKLKVI